MTNKNQEDLFASPSVPKGWYMFLVADSLHEIPTLPAFRDSYFCNNPAEKCCYTRSQKKAVHKLMNAMEMIKQYGKKQNIDVETYLVHCLKQGEKQVHAAVIGPLDIHSEQDILKIDQYARTRVPVIRNQNIYYQAKLQYCDIINNMFPLCIDNDFEDEEIEWEDEDFKEHMISDTDSSTKSPHSKDIENNANPDVCKQDTDADEDIEATLASEIDLLD